MPENDQRSSTSGRDIINTLPNELLVEIFAYGAPVPREEHPYRIIVLGAVCSRWRAVMLDFPTLWSRIYIPVHIVLEGNEISRPRYEENKRDEQWTSRLRDTVELYLTRSKKCNISVNFVQSRALNPLLARWQLSLVNLAGLLRDHMHRCYELHVFQGTPQVYTLLSDPDLKMPLLESLTLPIVSDLPFIRSATKLQTIRAECIERDFKGSATVKNVELATTKPGGYLPSFPKAKIVTLLPLRTRRTPPTSRVFRSNSISSLTVVATWDTMVTIQELLSEVELPNLESLTLSHVGFPGPPLRSDCIRRPLEGSSSLKELALREFPIRSQDMLNILEMAPRLTSLSIYDSSYPLVGPYRPISNTLLVALEDPNIVPDLEKLNIFWRYDVDIDGSRVERLLETRGDRLVDIETSKGRITARSPCVHQAKRN